jgi:hypothetical protein
MTNAIIYLLFVVMLFQHDLHSAIWRFRQVEGLWDSTPVALKVQWYCPPISPLPHGSVKYTIAPLSTTAFCPYVPTMAIDDALYQCETDLGTGILCLRMAMGKRPATIICPLTTCVDVIQHTSFILTAYSYPVSSALKKEPKKGWIDVDP